MPCPPADSKFVLNIPKIFKHTQFFDHTQNVFGILKCEILLPKLDYLSILKIFTLPYIQNFECPGKCSLQCYRNFASLNVAHFSDFLTSNLDL